MSCICQHLIAAKNLKKTTDTNSEKTSTANIIDLATANIIDESKSEVSASELSAAKAEIWLLRKGLADAKISIENLENLVKTMITKQNQLLAEMYELKQQNADLQDECRLQRDFQMMERNAMMREMHEIKVVLGQRTKVLEETVQKNADLSQAVQDVNEKILVMGMKFLELKKSRLSNRFSESIPDDRSDVEPCEYCK